MAARMASAGLRSRYGEFTSRLRSSSLATPASTASRTNAVVQTARHHAGALRGTAYLGLSEANNRRTWLIHKRRIRQQRERNFV